MTLLDFKKLFQYKDGKAGYVGVEREAYVIDAHGIIVPRAKEVLDNVMRPILSFSFGSGDSVSRPGVDWFGYELSACQIESRVGPITLDKLTVELRERSNYLQGYGFLYTGLKPAYIEIAPATMPLDVYPDPTGRYQKIVKGISREALLAACRVAGTHIHIGMKDHDMALHVYNYVIRHMQELCEVGNGSFGERLAIYKQMAPDYHPRPYKDWEDFYQYALEKGFAEDPRKCWSLVRISVHGTIEFRMFGSTESEERIVMWAKRCHELCEMAMMTA